ncbi:YdaS family helix-turn-helix protein [Delftia sp. PS-11]|uniref:YdaS family helix-turn-helix protein n=1 Tax=Delftia sp. PS-11 TaxID=2767222 RepID=UPI002466C97D|nr:helix-turn-helix domain-containing protein [Delftia sp. PS-11]
MTQQTALTPHEALVSAIRKAGSQSALARLVGKKQAHVSFWLKSGKGAPAEYCPSIEAGTGVLCEHLRPHVRWEVLLHRGASKAEGV